MNVESYITNLVKLHKYKKLAAELSLAARDFYLADLPPQLLLLAENGDCLFTELFTSQKTKITLGFNRIVIGDYGAFIEFDRQHACLGNLTIQRGQEFRIDDPQYNHRVKYLWLTTKDSSQIKIYYQKRTVPYADYLPGMFYVSPTEIFF